jgi:hypothetical protein
VLLGAGVNLLQAQTATHRHKYYFSHFRALVSLVNIFVGVDGLLIARKIFPRILLAGEPVKRAAAYTCAHQKRK